MKLCWLCRIREKEKKPEWTSIFRIEDINYVKNILVFITNTKVINTLQRKKDMKNDLLENAVLNEKLKFYKLANGLLSIGYIAIGVWMIVQVWSLLF